VLYRQHEPAGLLPGKEQECLFECKQHRLRQRILELIGKLPGSALADFVALLSFRKHFLHRVEYVSELLLYFLVETGQLSVYHLLQPQAVQGVQRDQRNHHQFYVNAIPYVDARANQRTLVESTV